jgi:hypothetical protein
MAVNTLIRKASAGLVNMATLKWPATPRSTTTRAFACMAGADLRKSAERCTSSRDCDEVTAVRRVALEIGARQPQRGAFGNDVRLGVVQLCDRRYAA